MFFEKQIYSEDFPINIRVIELDEYPIHYHQDLELIFVMQGKIALRNGACEYELSEGAVFTNTAHEVHKLTGIEEKSVIATIHIETEFFKQYFPSLSRACYRTYSKDSNNPKQKHIREMVSKILSSYINKAPGYIAECVSMMVQLIEYIDENFTVFHFEGDKLVNFEAEDEQTISRINRIVRYIYGNYNQKITLKELAKREYLSEFYLSHVIKDYTGLNFRDFLSFARAEWSEISLLGTDDKISKIAKNAGFSTTDYYEKFFEKWFGLRPSEYRKINRDSVLGRNNPLQGYELSTEEARALIGKPGNTLYAEIKSAAISGSEGVSVMTDVFGSALAYVNPKLEILISLSDFRKLGYSMFSHIDGLKPEKVTIIVEPSDARGEVNDLYELFLDAGYNVQMRPSIIDANRKSYGYDSIAYPIMLFNNIIATGTSEIAVRLRDDDDEELLKGSNAVLTSNGIKKSSYFAYQALSLIQGDVIDWGPQYCVIRTEGNSFVIIVNNCNDNIKEQFVHGDSPEEVSRAIYTYDERLEIDFDLNVLPGKYNIIRYSLSKKRNLFKNMLQKNRSKVFDVIPEVVYETPYMSVSTEEVKTALKLHFSIQGTGIHLMIVEQQED